MTAPSTESPRLDKQAFSLAAQMGIAGLLQESDNIEVEVESDLGKLAQGEADFVWIKGRNWVFNPILKIHDLAIQTGPIHVNPLSALVGKIELNQPIHANTRLVLTETELNSFINSELARQFIKKAKLEIAGKSFRLEPQVMKLSLLESGRIAIKGEVIVYEGTTPQTLDFEGLIKLRSEIPRVHLESFQTTNGYGISLRLAVTFLDHLNQLIDRPQFHILGTVFELKDLIIEANQITLLTHLTVEQFPTL